MEMFGLRSAREAFIKKNPFAVRSRLDHRDSGGFLVAGKKGKHALKNITLYFEENDVCFFENDSTFCRKQRDVF